VRGVSVVVCTRQLLGATRAARWTASAHRHRNNAASRCERESNAGADSKRRRQLGAAPTTGTCFVCASARYVWFPSAQR